MNAEELTRLVERARAAEPPPPQAPQLLPRARRAARRRRVSVVLAAAVATSTAVAVTATAGVSVPGWLGGDRAHQADIPGLSLGSEELSTYGGPCPASLPAPTDATTDGFGTTTPAAGAPALQAPDAAWVCRYGAHNLSASGGPRWQQESPPRRLDAALLPVVTSALGDLVPAPRSPVCSLDLGARWLLVTSADGDLTGTTVDDFGCREIRLTDNPFTTAPGDPTADRPDPTRGSVAGVLSGPASLPADLQTWWDTSTAEREPSSPPDELQVTCTATGPVVESTTVAAQPGGVVVVARSTLPRGSYLTYDATDGPSGADRIPVSSKPTTYAVAPGTLTLGCVNPPQMDTSAVSVDVVDPGGYWRPETLADYGCASPGSITDWVAGLTGHGDTAVRAVEQMLTDFPGNPGTDAYAAPTGYSGAATQTWLIRNPSTTTGAPTLAVEVTSQDGRYVADPAYYCGSG